MSNPVQRVPTESENKNWAIFPHRDEFAVCHLGTIKVAGQDMFQTGWVIDHVCATVEQAAECQKDEIKKAKVRNAQIMADMAARSRRK